MIAVMMVVAVMTGATMPVAIVPAARQAEAGDKQSDREECLTHIILLTLNRQRLAASICSSDRKMARVTGLEPATSGVTGRRSNQLSYTRVGAPLPGWRGL